MSATRRDVRRLAAALVLAGGLVAGCSGGSGGGGEAAVVAGEKISEREVTELAKQWREAERAQDHDGAWKPLPEKRLKQLVVLQLIKVRYVAQAAKEHGVGTAAGKVAEVASSEIADDEFDGTGWGKSSFEAAMRSSVLSKALAEKIFPSISIEEAKIRAYYDKHPEISQASWSANVGLAFFREAPGVPLAPGDGFESSARQAGAEEVIATQPVDAQSPLPPELLDAIPKMRAGTVGAALKAGQGFWVVSAREVKTVAPKTYDAAHADIERHLADQERQTRFSMWLVDELKKADIEVSGKYGAWPKDWL